MSETVFLSWAELELLFRRLEEGKLSEYPCIQIERKHILPTQERTVAVRTHYRYRDYSILSASVVQ